MFVPTTKASVKQTVAICGFILLSTAFFPACKDSENQMKLPNTIEVTGENRRWTTRYPGRDGRLRTDDDLITPGQIALPLGVPVTLQLKSRDFLYLLDLPHCEASEIAVPDMTFQLEVVPEVPGDFDLIGGQMCGRPDTRHGTYRV
ncbi:MAG: hypothetical protein AAF514_05175, partial [Verrucomicrobiota bacterium]